MNQNIGRIIWVVTIAIMAIGLIALYSASYENLRVSQRVFYDQLFCALIGLGIVFLVSRFDYRQFYEIAYVFYGVTIFLLVFVLVSGRHVLGAKRWIELGFFNFQPSELAKLAIILVLARYFSHQRKSLNFYKKNTFGVMTRDLLFPLFLTIVPMLLIFKQPDLGTAILIFGIFLVMIFISDIPMRYLAGFLGLCVVCVPFLWIILKDYQRQRLMVFLNPNIDPLGAGYTIIQSRIAIGSGRLFGKGWLSGTQNQLNFLPERHTDFIFSVIGEEWGFVGAGVLLFCFFVLIYCGLKIAGKTQDRFGLMMAVGIVTILTLQTIINIGMVLGLCPVVGLTLPLVSYGRSSFLLNLVMIGFLLNLNKRRSTF
ncbi:MAG: rod shape-determining protein RodA [Candidatus Omnitrophota bacterium]